MVVFRAVILIIFVTLTMTLRSVAEAAHVILAEPLALTGGVLLQAWTGFNVSVAVWVGYIALFGTAIPTGVVMVTYLKDAVQAKARELGRAPGPRRTGRRRQGRGTAASVTQGNDGGHHHRLPHPHLRA